MLTISPEALKWLFPLLDQQVGAANSGFVRVLALQNLLDGKAQQYWRSLRADRKATYVLVSAALRQKSPVDNTNEWTTRVWAVAEMEKLVQGDTTSEYAEKAQELFAALGDEYSLMLATRFMSGLR